MTDRMVVLDKHDVGLGQAVVWYSLDGLDHKETRLAPLSRQAIVLEGREETPEYLCHGALTWSGAYHYFAGCATGFAIARGLTKDDGPEHEIAAILRDGAVLRRSQAHHRDRIEAWEKRITERADAAFQAAVPSIKMKRNWADTVDTGVLWSIESRVEGGWDPILVVRGVADATHRHVNTAHGWISVRKDARSRKVYPHDRMDVALPFDIEAVVAAAQSVADDFGVPWRIEEHLLVTAVKDPKDFDEVRVRHPGCEVIGKGEGQTRGWDIGDPWVVIRDAEGVIWAYWSDNGHGFGYDHWATTDGRGSQSAYGQASIKSFREWAIDHDLLPPKEIL